MFPFLLVFAGFGANELVDALRQRRTARAVLGIAIAVAVYLLSALIPVRRQNYSAQAWTEEGESYLDQRKPGPAIVALRRALAVQPSAYPARYALVNALAGSGRVEEAAAEFRQLSIDGTSAKAQVYVRLASARLAVAHRDFARAAAICRAGLAADPNDALTTYMLGLVYISMDSLVQAREYLSRAAALDPGQHATRDALKAVESRLSH